MQHCVFCGKRFNEETSKDCVETEENGWVCSEPCWIEYAHSKDLEYIQKEHEHEITYLKNELEDARNKIVFWFNIFREERARMQSLLDMITPNSLY